MKLRYRAGRREWMWRCLLVFVSAGLTVSALELTLRIVVDRYRCDDRLGWTYRPGSRALVFNWTGEFVHFVRFNRDGLRDDREPPTGPAVGAFRIVVLGDSFSTGLQVPTEASFPKLLEARLGAAAVKGSRIEVWNAAVDGFSTAQSLRMFVERVARYQPNVVLLGLFLANDLADNVLDAGSSNHYLATRCGRPYFELNRSGALVEAGEGTSVRQPHSRLDRLLRRSELYANLFQVRDSSPVSFLDWDVFTGRNSAAVDSAWVLTRALVRELDRQVQAKGGRLTVLLMPHEAEARGGPETPAARSNGMNFDRAHVFAEAFLRETGIPYIDLYPPFRKAVAKGEHPYLHRDMHWTRLGHAIVAEDIERWLVDHCAELGLPVVRCTP